MVNHYLLSDDELLDRLIDVIECSLEIDEMFLDEEFDIDADCHFTYKRSREYREIRKELLDRMKKER
jgi:hypothetical protein